MVLHDLCIRLDNPDPGSPAPVRVGPPDQPVVSRWALPTLGGSSGQTLAGALSTGTHGTDVHLPPLANAVRALHLVGPGGRQHWIERSVSVTCDAALRRTYPEIEIHRDDEMLAAAVVALGRFGIIYSVLLDVVPQFSLRSVTRTSDWDTVAGELRSGRLLDEHRAVQIVVSPYPRSGRRLPGKHVCYVTTRDRVARPTKTRSQDAGRLLSRIVNGKGTLLPFYRLVFAAVWLVLGFGVVTGSKAPNIAALALLALGIAALPLGAGRPGNVVAALCAWANNRGWWPFTARIVRGLLAAAQRPSTSVGVSFQAMASPPWADQYYRGNSVEVFFDATKPDYLDTITNKLLPQIVAQAQDGRAIAGWFSLRFTARSDALLAMQQWKRTVSIEVAVLRGIPGSVEALRALEAIAVACNGRVHWGQQHDLEATTVAEAFPKLQSWRARLASLCRNEIERRTFENEFCRQRGLTL